MNMLRALLTLAIVALGIIVGTLINLIYALAMLFLTPFIIAYHRIKPYADAWCEYVENAGKAK